MPPLSSPSARFPFVPLSSGSGYSASCSSFQPSIGSASQGLSQRPDAFFRPRQIFLFLTDWFPVRSLRFCLFSSPVCSRSLFPDSLPQPFHRCFGILRLLQLPFPIRPCVRSLRFHPASFPPLSFPFAPVRLGLCYLVSVSSFPCFKLPPHSGFHSAGPSSAFLSVRFFRSARLFQPSFPPAFPFGSPLLFPSRFFSAVRFPPSFRFPPSPFGFFGPLPSGFGTQFSCSSFHRLRSSPHSGFFLRLPSLSGSGLPLSFFLPCSPLRFLCFLRFRSSSVSPPRFHASFSASSALGFGLLGIMIHPEN